MTPDDSLDLTFLICTFHREALLSKALLSIDALDDIDRVRCEIIVVDNSDEGSARAAVEAFQARTAVEMRYLGAHPPNIAVARNAGVAAARGKYVAMIDDDMTLRPDWLGAVAPLLASGEFDALFGPVEPEFENPALASREALQFFHRTLALGKGAPIRALGRRKTRDFTPATSNSVIRRACLAGRPFNPDYGRSGGEDVDLFFRLERAGRRFAWVADARAVEFVPARRCEAEYLERRNFVGGQIFAVSYIGDGRDWTRIAYVSLSSRLQLTALFLKALLQPAKTPEEARARAMRRASIRGKLAWRRLVPIYAEESKTLLSQSR